MNTETPSNTKNYQSLSEYQSKKKFGLSPECPLTESEFNWIFKQRENNGFSKAFVKISARSFLVHVPSFVDCLNAKRGA